MSTPRHGYGRYGYSTVGASKRIYTGFDAPWYIGTRTEFVRVDGLSASEPLSPVVPGETVTVDCTFAPQPANGEGSDNHVGRFEAVQDLLVRAPDVDTYASPGGEASYREQHGDADGTQLVLLGPLATWSSATVRSGDTPPDRDSIHEPRWAVVVGGETRAPLPDRVGRVQLETVTIASLDTFATRELVRDAREFNGF